MTRRPTLPGTRHLPRPRRPLPPKHTDRRLDHAEVRRSRRLVVSSIATVENYEYGYYWYLYQDAQGRGRPVISLPSQRDRQTLECEN